MLTYTKYNSATNKVEVFTKLESGKLQPLQEVDVERIDTSKHKCSGSWAILNGSSPSSTWKVCTKCGHSSSKWHKSRTATRQYERNK